MYWLFIVKGTPLTYSFCKDYCRNTNTHFFHKLTSRTEVPSLKFSFLQYIYYREQHVGKSNVFPRKHNSFRRLFNGSLGLRVRISPEAWISGLCECCVLSGRGVCDGPINRPEESYWLWCVIACDLETSSTRRPRPALGCGARKKKKIYI